MPEFCTWSLQERHVWAIKRGAYTIYSLYTPEVIKKLYPDKPSAIYTDSSLFEHGHVPLVDAFAASRPLFQNLNALSIAPTSGTSFPVAFIADQDEASRGI
jgi:hypothetical protein